MNEVRVHRGELLSALERNLKTHRAHFEEAMDAYKQKAIQLLEEHIERIKANAPERVMVSLPMPEDHTRDYEVAIQQVEWSLDDDITLSQSQFRTYVLDDWDWKPQWAETYSTYTGNEL